MPNIGKVLRDEISRISRKEAKAAVSPLRKTAGSARQTLASLKRRLALLEKSSKRLQAVAAKMEASQSAPPASAPEGREWISGRGIKSLRKRLGLSQADLAVLAGVSDQAVYMWERKSGMLRLRSTTKARVFDIRGLGAREAQARLAEARKAVKGKKAAATRGRKGRGKRK